MGTFTRRDFLKASAVNLGSACCLKATGLLDPHMAVAQTRAGNAGRTWIQIFLDGGCDCENLLVPFGLADYYAMRPLISIPSGNVLVTEAGVSGLHPSFTNIHAAFNAGDAAIVRRVGTEKSTRSHNEEQETFSGFSNGTGYAGRLWDAMYQQSASISDFSHFTLRMGVPSDSYCTRPAHRPINLDSLGNYNFTNMNGVDNTYSGTQENAQRKASLAALVGVGQTTGMPGLSKNSTESAFANISSIAQAVTNWNNTGGPNQATFGNNSPGPAVRDAAILTQALDDGLFGSTAMIINCSTGGFDTHSAQGGTAGNQATLFQRLDQAVGAFRNRAIARGFWNDTVISIATEFSRTVRGNDSGGTDHAKATVFLVIGGAVNGGVKGTALTNADFSNNPQNSIATSYRFETFYDQIATWLGLDPTGLWDNFTPPNYGITVV